MALRKPIKQSDGTITNYHRILYIQVTTNRQNSIAVISYTDGDARKAELDGSLEQPYSVAVTYETDYDESMTVKDAYEYLKTLPEFDGAGDILDEKKKR